MVNIKHFLVATIFPTISQLAVFSQQITFEKGIYDFGKVELNSESERLLKFRNTGADTLIIISAPTTACGCDMATIKDNKTTYAPGEEGTLIYKFDTESPRKFDNKITIQTNGISEFVTVRVKWEVLPSNVEHTDSKQSEPHKSILCTADSLIDISVNIEEIIWQDSTKMIFLAISHHGDRYNLKYSNLWPNYYRNLGGPITILPPFGDSCYVYPVFTKKDTSYFLLDDFNHITDSAITLTITVSEGAAYQNYAATFDMLLVLPMSEIRIKLNSLPAYPGSILANKDWYARWTINNPAYKDQRTMNTRRQCK